MGAPLLITYFLAFLIYVIGTLATRLVCRRAHSHLILTLNFRMTKLSNSGST